MFGRKSRTSRQPHGTAMTSTTHNVHSTAPHQPAHTSTLMSRFRPRHKATRTHGSHGVAAAPVAVTTSTTRPVKHSGGMFGRQRRHTRGKAQHHHATTSSTAPARKTSMGDKMSGAMLRLRGSISGRPGVERAGARRMHGTDGRSARRYY